MPSHWALQDPSGDWVYRYSARENIAHDIAGTELANAPRVLMDRAPGDLETFDGVGAWTWDLVSLRETRWRAAKLVRDAKVSGGCETSFGWVDTDAASRLNISGAVAMAQLVGELFEIDWRMESNDLVTLDAAQMIQLGTEVGAFVSACYAASFAISDALEEAEDMDAISAVDIAEGYP